MKGFSLYPTKNGENRLCGIAVSDIGKGRSGGGDKDVGMQALLPAIV